MDSSSNSSFIFFLGLLRGVWVVTEAFHRFGLKSHKGVCVHAGPASRTRPVLAPKGDTANSAESSSDSPADIYLERRLLTLFQIRLLSQGELGPDISLIAVHCSRAEASFAIEVSTPTAAQARASVP